MNWLIPAVLLTVYGNVSCLTVATEQASELVVHGTPYQLGYMRYIKRCTLLQNVALNRMLVFCRKRKSIVV